jgi:hypothetical protein
LFVRRIKLRRNEQEPAPTLSGPELVEALTDAHRQSVVIVRNLLIAQEVADACLTEAETAVRTANAHPADAEAKELAADARTRALFADAEELRATERWAQHLGEVRALLELAEGLFADEQVCAWPTAGCSAGGSLRKRSRGHCSGP